MTSLNSLKSQLIAVIEPDISRAIVYILIGTINISAVLAGISNYGYPQDILVASSGPTMVLPGTEASGIAQIISDITGALTLINVLTWYLIAGVSVRGFKVWKGDTP